MLSIVIAEFERERIGPGLQTGDVDLTRNAEFEAVARSKWAELGGVDSEEVESLKTAVVGRKSEAIMIRWLRKELMSDTEERTVGDSYFMNVVHVHVSS
jgi:hypothetical protein